MTRTGSQTNETVVRSQIAVLDHLLDAFEGEDYDLDGAERDTHHTGTLNCENCGYETEDAAGIRKLFFVHSGHPLCPRCEEPLTQRDPWEVGK